MCNHQNIIHVDDGKTDEGTNCNECGFKINKGVCKCSRRGDRGLVPYCLDCKTLNVILQFSKK